MNVEFWVSLIVVKKEQTVGAVGSLKANCTYIDNWCWIFEGDEEALVEDGVQFNVVAEGAVPSLADLPKEQLVELSKDVFGVDIYTLSYNPPAQPDCEEDDDPYGEGHY